MLSNGVPIRTAGRPATVTASGGLIQTAIVNTAFATPFRVQVKDGFGNPVNSASVQFYAPDASTTNSTGRFGATNIVTITTNASGFAQAPTFTANGVEGDYTVLATVLEADNTVTFNLTNLTACTQSPFIVTNDFDDGVSRVCGTLTRALIQATPGVTITFSVGPDRSVTIGGDGLASEIPAGVNLDGGPCIDVNGDFDPIKIKGFFNLPLLVDGLTLSGNSTLRNIAVSGFTGKQIVVTGGGNRFLCGVKASKELQ